MDVPNLLYQEVGDDMVAVQASLFPTFDTQPQASTQVVVGQRPEVEESEF